MNDADRRVGQILDYLEPRVDLAHVRQAAARHRAALCYEPVDRIPLVCYLPYQGDRFTPYPYPEAFADPAKMMVNELLVGFTSIYHAVDLRDDAPSCLRPNLGVGIVASLFGAKIRVLEEGMPWVEPLEGGADAMRRLLDRPLHGLDAGLLPRVRDQYAYFREALAPYPACREAFRLTLPDLQGPFSTAELLWGSGIYLALFDSPELVSAALMRVAEVMALVLPRLEGEVRGGLGPGLQYQHGSGVGGRILLRNDSAVNVSPAHYRRLILPADAWLAETLGSVGIHYCGDGSHHAAAMLSIPGLASFDLGQPEKVNLDRLYALAAPQRVALARLTLPEAELSAGRVKVRFPTGVNLLYTAPDIATAHDVWRRYVSDDAASRAPGIPALSQAVQRPAKAIKTSSRVGSDGSTWATKPRPPRAACKESAVCWPASVMACR
jgi:hypothetical protein